MNKIDWNLTKKYIKQINPDPDIYCLLTCRIHNKGDPDCDHDWVKIKDEDNFAVWECSKCKARLGCDVWD